MLLFQSHPKIVIPANAGTHSEATRTEGVIDAAASIMSSARARSTMDPGVRRDDGWRMGRSLLILGAALSLAACQPKQEAAEAPKAEAPPVVPAPAAGAPLVSVKYREDMLSLPSPYDETATPAQITAMIDAAYERAKTSGKRVVIDFGGNWCSWCRGVAGVMELPEVKPFVERNFEIVYVPINTQQGAIDRNQHVFTRLKLPANPDHYPWMVVTEADGTILHSSYDITKTAIGNATPQSWVNWLAQYAKPAEAKV